jgi:hypothetical protein
MNTKKPIRTYACIIISLAALSQAGAGLAQDELEAAPTESLLSAAFGVDFTSAYFFRGYLQEDAGLIAQPWFEASMVLVEPDGDSDITLSGTLGTWSSIHSEQTGALGGSVDSWYENDVYAGLTLATGNLEFGLGYSVYQYPNSTFNTVQEIGATAAYDISEFPISEFVGTPSIGIFTEVDNSNVGTGTASYLQLDAGPSFALTEDEETSLSIPVSVGVSLDDYYVGTDDEFFGFASIGASVDHNIPIDRAGTLTITAGVNVLLLGDTTKAANNGDEADASVFVGCTMSF